MRNRQVYCDSFLRMLNYYQLLADVHISFVYLGHMCADNDVFDKHVGIKLMVEARIGHVIVLNS